MADEFNLGNVLAANMSLGNTFQRRKNEEEQAKKEAQMTVSADPLNGTVNMQNVDEQYLTNIMKLAEVGQKTLANYEQMESQNRAQQERFRKSPWMNTFAQIAAAMAENDPNPYTRGMGVAAHRLNPTLPELQRQGMEITAAKERTAESLARYGEQAVQHRAIIDQKKRMDAERTQNNWEQLRTRFENPAIQHGIVGNKEEFYAEGRALGKSIAELDRSWQNIDSLASKRATQKLEDDQRAVEKAKETAKATAPIKINLEGEKVAMKEASAKRLIEARKNAALEVTNTRYKGIQDRILTRLDANRVEKLAEVPSKDREHLIALSNMDSFVDRMKNFVGTHGSLRNYTGRLQGLATQKLPQWLSDEDRQVLQHMFMVEKKRVIDFGGAGVRGWAPGEDAIKKLGVIETLTPAAADRVMDEIKHQIDFERQNVVSAYPYAPWDKTPELLGGPESQRYREAAGRSKEYFDAIGDVEERAQERSGMQPSQQTPGKKKYPWEK